MIGSRVTTLAASLCALGVLVAGCGSGAPAPEPSSLAAVNPRPEGAADLAPVPNIAPDADCDDEATLRPLAMPPPGAMAPGTPMARIVDQGRLRVGVDQNTYLFGFRDPTTGRLEGFDIDLAREIARAIFGDPGKVELVSVTAAERVRALATDKVDLVVRTFSATCERRRQVDFSTVYYRSGQSILAPKDSGITGAAQLAGKRVCVANGTTAAGPVFAAVERPTVLGVTNWTDCLVALQQNHVDAISGDDPILFGLAQQDRNLRIVGESIGTDAYAVGIRKGEDELVRFVNGVLERIRDDGTWQRLYNARLSALGPSAGLPPPRYVG
ncbi:glutamate ABC transporter substrate-binding protein [Nocardia callitridis]|uniref:Glutamate ABC transporter substrate-binding protein n=1 Tax=Nocardia callitridis TaxID=648753 RepID=A0ABP9K3R5_9NOCA